VNGAFGIVSSDVTHEYSLTKHFGVPANEREVNEVFSELEQRALAELKGEGFSEENIQFHRSIGMQFGLQVHEVITPVPVNGTLTREDLEDTYLRFERLYEQKHGKGSAYKEAGMEITGFQLRAAGRLTKPSLSAHEPEGSSAEKALIDRREVSFDGQRQSTAVYDFDALRIGNQISGPAIILTPVTTMVIQPGQRAEVAPYKNVIIHLEGRDS